MYYLAFLIIHLYITFLAAIYGFLESVRQYTQESLCIIIDKFEIPKKHVRLIIICTKRTKYQVWIDDTLSEAFIVETGLKQGDALSSTLFNLALEKAARMMHN